MRDLYFFGIQFLSLNAIIMVLGSDQHTAGGQMLYRMVASVMPELQAARTGSQRAADQLVAQANAKNSHAAVDQFFNCIDQIGQPGRVAGGRSRGRHHPDGRLKSPGLLYLPVPQQPLHPKQSDGAGYCA